MAAQQPLSMQEVFDNNRYKLKYAAVMSTKWFEEQPRLLKGLGVTSHRMIKDNDDAVWANRIIPGRLYLYKYDAKHKATLPYWDRFPLVFPLNETDDGKGFYGLNMHYIHYEYRIKILNSLLHIEQGGRYTANMRLALSWELIKNSAKLAPLKPCLHMYLYNHLRSGMKQVHPRDWATAMMLPIASWASSNNTKVWKDSRKKF